MKLSNRLSGLDALRGLALLSMIAYHTVWDLVYIFGVEWRWFESYTAYIWQQSICCSFIFISGFSWALGRGKLQNGILIFSLGAALSIATAALTPETPVVLGVLTLLGSCMIIMSSARSIANRLRHKTGSTPHKLRIYSKSGLAVSLLLFFLTKNIGDGYIGILGIKFLSLPESWYSGIISAFFGLPPKDFFSVDYFPLIPWLFLFEAGYFLCRLYLSDHRTDKFPAFLGYKGTPLLEWLGRHSLLIYLLHQPLIYGFLYICL